MRLSAVDSDSNGAAYSEVANYYCLNLDIIELLKSHNLLVVDYAAL